MVDTLPLLAITHSRAEGERGEGLYIHTHSYKVWKRSNMVQVTAHLAHWL